MKFKKTIILILLYCYALTTAAQLVSRSSSIRVSGATTAKITVQPALTEELINRDLISIDYHQSLNRGWNYTLGVSGIERLFPTGLAFVARGKHVSATQAIEKKIYFMQNSRIKNIESRLHHFIVWETTGGKAVTDMLTWDWRLRTSTGAIVSFIGERRTDLVDAQFELGEINILQGNYNFSSATLSYRGSSNARYAMLYELVYGTYYDNDRISFRAGPRIKLTNYIKMSADVEYSKVTAEQSVVGCMTRAMADFRFSKNLSVSIFCLYNSFSQMTLMMSSLQFNKRNNFFKIEYRDLRNADFQTIITHHPLFSSNILVQYSMKMSSSK